LKEEQGALLVVVVMTEAFVRVQMEMVVLLLQEVALVAQGKWEVA
jgi:hypothetical protein